MVSQTTSQFKPEDMGPLTEEPELVTRNWFDCKREGSVVLKVLVTNRLKKKVKVRLTLEGDNETTNAKLPLSEIKELFYDADTKCLLNLVKIDPTKAWGVIRIKVVATEVDRVPSPPAKFLIYAPPVAPVHIP